MIGRRVEFEKRYLNEPTEKIQGLIIDKVIRPGTYSGSYEYFLVEDDKHYIHMCYPENLIKFIV